MVYPMVTTSKSNFNAVSIWSSVDIVIADKLIAYTFKLVVSIFYAFSKVCILASKLSILEIASCKAAVNKGTILLWSIPW